MALTVKQLIEALQKLPPELPVFVTDTDVRWDRHVETVAMPDERRVEIVCVDRIRES